MRLQRYFLGFILALLLVGGISYFVGHKSVEAPSDIVAIEQENMMASASSTSLKSLPLKGETTLKDLHTQNKNLVCDVTSIDNSKGAFSGKLYLTEKNLRGDFAVQQGGQLFSAGMYILSDMLYFWTDTPRERISFKIKSDAALIIEPGPNFNIGLNDSVAYDCEPETSSSDVFVLPAELGFPEITE